MRVSFSLKTGIITFVFAVVLVIAGIYIGTFYAERKFARSASANSLNFLFSNLRVIEYIREGKNTDAIRELDSMNDVNLAYLIYYDDAESETPEFKKKVLADFSKERADHPRNNCSFEAYPELQHGCQKRQRDIEHYLERNR